MYTTAAPLLGLPSERQARRVRVKETKYLPGLDGNASKECKPLQIEMDGNPQ